MTMYLLNIDLINPSIPTNSRSSNLSIVLFEILLTNKFRGIKDYFIDYESSFTYKYWNFNHKYFLTSHNLSFYETKFPTISDFNNISSTPRTRFSSTESISSSHSEWIVYNEIIIQSYLLYSYLYDSLIDNSSFSFKNIISYSNYKF